MHASSGPLRSRPRGRLHHHRLDRHAHAARIHRRCRDAERRGDRLHHAVSGAWPRRPDAIQYGCDLNIDWLLDLALGVLASEGVARSRADLIHRLDERVMQARPGEVVFHPFISDAGERGPFVAHDACAQFLELRSRQAYWDLMRAVTEELALAARDCYAAMGALPRDVRITGGAARSRAARCRGGTSRQVISSCCDANSGNGLGSDRRVPWPA